MGQKREKRPYDRFAEYLDYTYARDHNRRPYYGPNGFGHTYVIREDGFIYLMYHGTNIVCLAPNGDITLASGGWRSLTTKARINEVLPRNWLLYSHQGIWYLADPWGRKHVFADGMTIKYRGKKVIGAGQPIRPKDLKQLKDDIRRYASCYVQALVEEGLRPPTSEDCPLCHERVHVNFSPAAPTSLMCLYSTNPRELGRPKGDVLGDTEHIKCHMARHEYPPSMIINAASEIGISPLSRALIVERMGKNDPSGYLEGVTLDVVKEQLQRVLTRYLQRRYGMGV